MSMSKKPQEKGLLRKAGDAIMDFDASYAKAVSPDAMKDSFAYATRGIPLRDFGDIDVSKADGLLDKVVTYGGSAGLAATNIASRYALPAGGITLAGKGLYDLTIDMQGQSSGELDPV